MTDLPLAVFEQHCAIVGRTGSGKSFAARGMVERWLGEGERVCVVDPTDVWWGLRAAGDGPGLPVAVFGGEHADVPIGERSGARLAEIVAGRNLPAVIATAEMSSSDRHRFMSDFLAALYRHNRAPLHLVLDEADDLAPQNPLPENRRLLGDVDRIVRRGRVRGFAVLLITQRPAVLHKNVLSQASTLVAMRLPAPQDRKAIEGWISGQADIDQAREVLGSLSRLDRGEGWVWAPDKGVLHRGVFPPIATFDSMRTPEHGAAPEAPTVLAPVELGDLRALLTGVDEPDRPSPLRQADAAAIEAAEQRGREAGRNEGWTHGYGAALDDIDRVIARGLGELRCDANREEGRDDDGQPPNGAPSPSPRVRRVRGEGRGEGCAAPGAAAALPATAAIRAAAVQTDAGALPSSAAKMLAVLARGLRLSWAQTATLAGLKASGGHFNAGRKALRDLGLVEETASGVAATTLGIDRAGGALAPPSGADELVQWWRAALPRTPGRLLDQLHRQDGKWIRKDRLAEFLGLAPRGGHWNGAIAILRRNALIEEKDDKLRAAPMLRQDMGDG